MEREEIVLKIRALQRSRAKLKAYRDVIAYLGKYEGTLQRKLSDVSKKTEKLAKAGKDSKAYQAVLNDYSVLQYQIEEAKQIRLAMSEVALQINEDGEKVEQDFTDMANKVFAKDE